jgi:hypothetical protein
MISRDGHPIRLGNAIGRYGRIFMSRQVPLPALVSPFVPDYHLGRNDQPWCGVPAGAAGLRWPVA